jgi:predicted methyltransferase
MNHRFVVFVSVLLALGSLPIAAKPAPAFVNAAVNDAGRPDVDRQRDADRKPADMLAFAGVKQGSTVVELVPGEGYYTRILSKAIGPLGHLYAIAPAPRPDSPASMPDRTAAAKVIASQPGYLNVSVLVQVIQRLELPDHVDLVWTTQNYHDVHNARDIDMLRFNQSIYNALKPGGIYLVSDHTAAPGAPADVTSTLHRIDPETVKKEVLAAGFEFEAGSDLLRNPRDPHTEPVFDPSIRGKTDQFVLKFRKPAKAN